MYARCRAVVQCGSPAKVSGSHHAPHQNGLGVEREANTSAHPSHQGTTCWGWNTRRPAVTGLRAARRRRSAVRNG